MYSLLQSATLFLDYNEKLDSWYRDGHRIKFIKGFSSSTHKKSLLKYFFNLCEKKREIILK